MAKDAFYFPHDCNARHDPALETVCLEHGLNAYACFFIAIELLREQNEYRLPLKFKPAMFSAWRLGPNPINLNQCTAIFNTLVNEELLQVDADFIWSNTLNDRMAAFDEVKAMQRASGREGGLKSQAKRRGLEGALEDASSAAKAIKERRGDKGEEIKENSTYVAFEQATQTAWNSFCNNHPNCSKVLSVSAKRRQKLKLRYQQPTFQDFDKILSEAALQPFLFGQNDRSWALSFDWLVDNDTNHLKVLEGRYRPKEGQLSVDTLEESMKARGLQPRNGSKYAR